MPNVKAQRVFTARNLSIRWDRPESEVRELVRSGKLRGSYLAGRLVRIGREELLEFELRHGVPIKKTVAVCAEVSFRFIDAERSAAACLVDELSHASNLAY